MTIDVISFTDTQFATLNAEQLLEVKEAQLKKNELIAARDEALQKEKQRLVGNGVFHSDRYTLLKNKIMAEYQAKIDLVREGLLFYLQYSMRPEESTTPEVETDAPYKVDYSLSYEERLMIVKNYYESTYSTEKEQFAAFKKDTVAPQYLGELYAPLYDYFEGWD